MPTLGVLYVLQSIELNAMQMAGAVMFRMLPRGNEEQAAHQGRDRAGTGRHCRAVGSDECREYARVSFGRSVQDGGYASNSRCR